MIILHFALKISVKYNFYFTTLQYSLCIVNYGFSTFSSYVISPTSTEQHLFISVPWKRQIKCTMLLRDKGLQSSLQKIVTFMFQALVLVQNIVTSAWHFYLCCTALFCLLLYLYSIVTHSEAENCHFDVSGFYREAKYLHFLPVFDKLIKGT